MQPDRTSEEQEIIIHATGKEGQLRMRCPYCSGNRKNKWDTPLSLIIDGETIKYQCWHCDVSGLIPLLERRPVRKEPWENRQKSSPPVELSPAVQVTGDLNDKVATFLQSRGISRETAVAAGCFSTRKWFRKAEKECDALAIPYHNPDGTTGIKYRNIEQKDFAWDGRGNTLLGIEQVDLEASGRIVITEGELDYLSLREAGVTNVLSVPNGAPQKVKERRVDPKDDRAFFYVWENEKTLNAASEIVIFTDQDGSGEALSEELARRIGKGKCLQVYPPKDCKDPNDVLLKFGSAALLGVINDAQPWPVAGVFNAMHYADQVDDLYISGPGKGLSTGLQSLDELFTISPGQVSIVSGLPGSGKSELVDQIMCNMATMHGWKFAICSFENPPPFHIVKLSEKYTGKPFFQGVTLRLSPEEKERAKAWINQHFVFMDFSDGESATIDMILERAKSAVQRLGVRGLVIDPYNYIQLGREESETKLISDMLTDVRRFAIAHDVHVWFIAHPQKMRRNENGSQPVPKGGDISGSAAWFAKADIGWSAARPEQHSPGEVVMTPCVEVHAWKIRFKWIGRLGECKLNYDTINGRYSDSANIDWEEVSQVFRDRDDIGYAAKRALGKMP